MNTETIGRIRALTDAELQRAHEEHASQCDGSCFEDDDHETAALLEVAGDLLARAAAAEAIIAGRAVAPTDAELDAHEAAGGTWTRATAGEWIFSDAGMDAEAARELRSVLAANAWAKPRWWALDADGRPCAWPSVDEVTP